MGAHHLVHLRGEGVGGVLRRRSPVDVVEEGGAGAEFATSGLKVTRKGEFLYSQITMWPSAQRRQARNGLWVFQSCMFVVSVA